jgi:hypothetical protein
MLMLDAFYVGFDYWNIFSIRNDMNAINSQKIQLQNAYKMVTEWISENGIPEVYNNPTHIGALVNYVFQGENKYNNIDIITIGTAILQANGRYDYQKKEIKPLIQD